MNSNSSGGKLEGFFTGKGFYIVLFLCAAVIGVSAWMMAAGNRTMKEEITAMNQETLDKRKVETVVIPPQREERQSVGEIYEEPVQVIAPETETEQESVPVLAQEETKAPAAFQWPLSGELERSHSSKTLHYDVTMRDWRTHEGIDILAPLGETVFAAHAGTVESVVKDDLMGTVVTVSHGDGGRTIYANLAEVPAVNPGDWVEPGSVIGAVGTTALAEIGQQTHLHFAVTVDGVSVDPLEYLPA